MKKNLFDSGEIFTMKEMFSEMHVVDIAENMEEMDNQVLVKVFRMLPKDKAAEVFAYLSRDIQEKIVASIADHELGNVIDELFVDDAVDFIEEMPANVVKRILATIPKETRDTINQFLKYPADSAGSVMTPEYVALKSDMTVLDAFNEIRAKALDKETIYTCYVTDPDRRLIGAISARTLLLSTLDQVVGDIMEQNIVFAYTADDKEELVADFSKYDLLAVPIVDSEKRLVGIVTIDDALDVQEEEATEDFEIMAAMSPSEDVYLKTSIWNLTKNRIPWLLLLMLSATFTGAIITGFEDALAVFPALVASIPMLMDTGGNAGSQSSVLCIRGMALGEIGLSDVLHVLWKEIRVAVICGALLVLVNFTRLMLVEHDILLALTVSAALYLTVLIAKTIGCLLPMAAKKLRLDPAVAASPVITTVVDASSLLVYFSLAKAILKI
ncbi:MAG: magnesium transporter [Clostridiales bacterium]|jgi:magnesium transporter|nr:magnesium transporter [Clostridiales bacterium]